MTFTASLHRLIDSADVVEIDGYLVESIRPMAGHKYELTSGLDEDWTFLDDNVTVNDDGQVTALDHGEFLINGPREVRITFSVTRPIRVEDLI